MKQAITNVRAREILDSRGTPTLEAEVSFADGTKGAAMVPSGASTGEHEALELRDGDPKRYGGKGVLKAIELVNSKIAPLLKGKSFADIQSLDAVLIAEDGTPQKAKLGANSILGVSMAHAHALANSQRRPLYSVLGEAMGTPRSQMALPVPLMNIINGGMHANNGLEIQEFMIAPHGFENFSEALRAGVEVFQTLKKKLEKMKQSTAVGDEGGFAPALESNTQALEVICESIQTAGYTLGKQISLALDVASSSFYHRAKGHYDFRWEGSSHLSSEGMISFYQNWLERFPIVSIEDGLDENDWSGWKALTDKFGKTVQLVGDDLFVTQTAFVQKGITMGAANAILIKVNQVGSLKETFETMALGKKNNYRSITSHRSGETEDVTIAHLAVGSGCGQIKTGSLSRSERTAKYNELLKIEMMAKEEGQPIGFARVF